MCFITLSLFVVVTTTTTATTKVQHTQCKSIKKRRNAKIKCAKGIRRRSMNELGEYDIEKYERGKN